MAGMEALGLQAPVSKPTGLIITETDGCFVDGIEVVTGATVGHRTLRIEDMGKIAATFIDVQTGTALRFAPRRGVRALAFAYASDADGRYQAQLQGYQSMPEAELFGMREVRLQPSLAAVLSTPELRVTCSSCGEEIINEREVQTGGAVLCRSCAGRGYYVDMQEVRRDQTAGARAPSQL